MTNEPEPHPLVTTSPLQEADESIDELWLRIDRKLALGLPAEITDGDIQRVVDYNLKMRRKFIETEEQGKRAGTGMPRASRKAAPKSVTEIIIDL